MIFLKRVFLFSALVSLTILFVAGCNQENSNNNNKSSLDKIKDAKKFIVGTEAAYAPFEYVENGKIVGYDPDILHEIFKDSGIEVEQVDLPFSGIFTALESQKIDAIITMLQITPERESKYIMLSPVARDDSIALTLVNKADDFKTIDDFQGKKIGVNSNSNLHKLIIEKNEEFLKEGKTSMDIVTYASQPDIFLDLKNGRVDIMLTSELTALEASKAEPDTYKKAFVIEEAYYGWAVRKEDKELADFINKKIIELKKSGKLAELQEKWLDATWDLKD